MRKRRDIRFENIEDDTCLSALKARTILSLGFFFSSKKYTRGKKSAFLF